MDIMYQISLESEQEEFLAERQMLKTLKIALEK